MVEIPEAPQGCAHAGLLLAMAEPEADTYVSAITRRHTSYHSAYSMRTLHSVLLGMDNRRYSVQPCVVLC